MGEAPRLIRNTMNGAGPSRCAGASGVEPFTAASRPSARATPPLQVGNPPGWRVRF